jgi:hypothetical protein
MEELYRRNQCKVVFARVEEDESGCSTLPPPQAHYRDGIHESIDFVEAPANNLDISQT